MDVETFADTECIQNSGIKVKDDLMDGFDEYIRILNRHGIKSTLFTLGNLAPQLRDRLSSCIAEGHSLALHSRTHVPPTKIAAERFREDILAAKTQMEELYGTEITGFRAPFFSMDKPHLNILRELGFRYDSSHLNYQPARHTVSLDLSDYRELRREIFRRKDFYEFGLPKGRFLGIPFPISGGGYVRLSLWWFVKIQLKQYLRKNNYYVFYLHPFELTKRKIPFIKELKSYDKYYIRHGIRSYGKRIEAIIRILQDQGYEFVTFDQLIELMENEHPHQK